MVALALLLGGAQQPHSEREVYFRDSFDGTALDLRWHVLHPSLATIEVADGALSLTPTQGGLASIWFEDAEGVLVYRTVTGDFTATARVHARRPGTSDPPSTPYRLGGLLARRPGAVSGARDSVHVALGAGVTGPCAEDKTTQDSDSDFVLYPIASADGELRIRRRGASFELAYRALGVLPWTVLRTHLRPDLPATLQVGMMAYSTPTPPDLVARFERFVLGR